MNKEKIKLSYFMYLFLSSMNTSLLFMTQLNLKITIIGIRYSKFNSHKSTYPIFIH